MYATPSQQSAQSRITFVRARRRRREVGSDNARKIRKLSHCCQRGLKELKSSGEWKRWLAYKFRDLASTGTPRDKAQTPGTVPAIPGRLATMNMDRGLWTGLDLDHPTPYWQNFTAHAHSSDAPEKLAR